MALYQSHWIRLQTQRALPLRLDWARQYGGGRLYYDAATQKWSYTHSCAPISMKPEIQFWNGFVWVLAVDLQDAQPTEKMWCWIPFSEQTYGWTCLNNGVQAPQKWFLGSYPHDDCPYVGMCMVSDTHALMGMAPFVQQQLPPPPPPHGMESQLAALMRRFDEKVENMNDNLLSRDDAEQMLQDQWEWAEWQREQDQWQNQQMLTRCEEAERSVISSLRAETEAFEESNRLNREAQEHLVTDAKNQLTEKFSEGCDSVRREVSQRQQEIKNKLEEANQSVQQQCNENREQLEEAKEQINQMPLHIIRCLMTLAKSGKTIFALEDDEIKLRLLESTTKSILDEPRPQEEEEQEEEHEDPDWTGSQEEPEVEGDPIDAEEDDNEEAVAPMPDPQLPVEADKEDNREEVGPVVPMPMPEQAPRQPIEDEALGQAVPVEGDAREEAAAPMPEPRQAVEEDSLGHAGGGPVAAVEEAREEAPAPTPRSEPRRSTGDPPAIVSRPMGDGKRPSHIRAASSRSRSAAPHSRAHLRGNSRSRRNAASRSRSAACHPRVRLRSNSRSHRRRR